MAEGPYRGRLIDLQVDGVRMIAHTVEDVSPETLAALAELGRAVIEAWKRGELPAIASLTASDQVEQGAEPIPLSRALNKPGRNYRDT